MNSYCEPRFWQQYNALPEDVRKIADKSFRLWLSDPTHPSLFFKPIPASDLIWSARIGLHYRALCIRLGNDCNWFFIGKHEDYERLIKKT